jgi:hypothetical protein
MNTMAQLAVLVAATVLAAGAALGMAWALLCGAFRLMQPAAVRSVQRPRLELLQGTRAVARGFGSR